TVVPEAVRRRQGALAGDRDDAVELVPVHRLLDVLRAAAVALVGVRAARAENGAADLRQTLHVCTLEGEEVSVDETAPPVPEAHEFDAILARALRHRTTDNGVEPGAVSARRQDPDLHTSRLLVPRGCFSRCTTPARGAIPWNVSSRERET